MTVTEMAKVLNLEELCCPDGQRQVSGGYAGDLLSWVMGRARAGNAWITIMSNVNTVAVATLADVSCVILAEGTRPDDGVLSKASEVGVNVFSSKLNTFELCAAIAELI